MCGLINSMSIVCIDYPFLCFRLYSLQLAIYCFETKHNLRLHAVCVHTLRGVSIIYILQSYNLSLFWCCLIKQFLHLLFSISTEVRVLVIYSAKCQWSSAIYYIAKTNVSSSQRVLLCVYITLRCGRNSCFKIDETIRIPVYPPCLYLARDIQRTF